MSAHEAGGSSRVKHMDLCELLEVTTKHSGYQELHRALDAVMEGGRISGKAESSRWEYMRAVMSFEGRRVLDIGANTGFFSLSAAIEGGASSVLACEGSPYHAEFLERAVARLGLSDRVRVDNRYYDFFNSADLHAEIALCLNVLHHLGDDFGDQALTLADARRQMVRALGGLASRFRWMWFQVGYNWKGDRRQPLFDRGLKNEQIALVAEAAAEAWSVDRIGIFNPGSGRYEDANDALLARFDEVGEFMNRPLFLMRSNISPDV